MIQNTRIALAPYQAEYQFPHIKRCFNRFWYDPSGSNPLSVFFYKKLLVGQGWDLLAIWILFRKSKTFLVVAFWFFAVTEGSFWIIHVRSAVFSDPSIWEIPDQLFLWSILESCVPAWPLAFKKSSCCEKVISGFSGRSHPARSGRVLQLPWWSCSPFFPRCGSSCYP